MRRAIVKPDHVGDLILSQPAIQALVDSKEIDALFVNSKNLDLAEFLFPGLDIQTIDFSHLNATNSNYKGLDLTRISRYEEVVFLRRDHILNENLVGELLKNCIFIGSAESHVALTQKNSLLKFFRSR